MGGRKSPRSIFTGAKSRGDQVSTAVKELGWTQAMLAQHLEVREATVSEWVHNRPEPPKVVILYLKLLVRFQNAQLGGARGPV